MDKIIDNINKLSLPVVILIASLVIGGFYYAGEVNKQKSIERQQEIKLQEERTKQDQVKQEQVQAKQEQDKTKQALDACITSAETNNFNYWYRECKSENRLTDRCISLHDMTFEEYAKQNNIPNLQVQGKSLNLKAIGDFNKEKFECGNCSLPFGNGDRIIKSLQDDKDRCLKEYPQK